MKITLLHYRYAPAVAGVERIMEEHARLAADAGHEVTVLTGSQESVPGADRRVRVVALPELAGNSTIPPMPPCFPAQVGVVSAALRPFLENADIVLVHNVLTMPFHMACTAALWQLADELPQGRIVNWVHDLAAANPDYTLGSEPPFDLLRRHHPAMRVVAISDHRARQFADLTGDTVDALIPNGIDLAGSLGLTPSVARFAREERLQDAGLLLLQPARILSRKNIELGLRVLAELKTRGWDARLLVTGAPDEHNASSADYHRELLELRRSLALEREVLFINSFFAVTNADLASLYALVDVLWFPSRHEGFGLPVIEGALNRILIFCADVPPMNTFPLPTAEFFDLDAGPVRIVDQLEAFLGRNASFLQARRAVLKRFAWDAVWPLIESFISTSNL